VLGWVGDELGEQQTAVVYTTGTMATDHPNLVGRFLGAFHQGGTAWGQAFMDADGNRKAQPGVEKMIGIVAARLTCRPTLSPRALAISIQQRGSGSAISRRYSAGFMGKA
jgi:hypothetical protein